MPIHTCLLTASQHLLPPLPTTRACFPPHSRAGTRLPRTWRVSVLHLLRSHALPTASTPRPCAACRLRNTATTRLRRAPRACHTGFPTRDHFPTSICDACYLRGTAAVIHGAAAAYGICPGRATCQHAVACPTRKSIPAARLPTAGSFLPTVHCVPHLHALVVQVAASNFPVWQFDALYRTPTVCRCLTQHNAAANSACLWTVLLLDAGAAASRRAVLHAAVRLLARATDTAMT